MPVDPEYAGRVYPPSPPYQVGREHVREFAAAVGATDPVHHDVRVARDRGYADVVAPPTYPVVIAQRVEAAFVADPRAGIDFTRVVHGEESLVHHAPVVAGEEIVGVLHVDRVREVAGNAMVSTRVELTTVAGEPRTTVTSSLVVRGDES